MNYYKQFLFTTFALLAIVGRVEAKNTKSVAIIADKGVMANNRTSLDKYAASIEADGIRTFIIEDKWGVPDSIRTLLQDLYKRENLEGAIFVGEIPVPMIRNGQHLSTAFKMDQRRDWQQSSIPSDRFYDDFDLRFDFIKRDSANTMYYYYNLSPDGAQQVYSEIYSARIKPPKYEGKTRYELLDNYFEKVVREKQQARVIDNISYFAGHGYNSNCMVARADERLALTGQFSSLASGKGSLNYIDYTYDDFVKHRLMAELGRNELDLAILHHHGAEDTQFLNGSPFTNMADKWLEMARKFFRGKIRGAKDTTASKQYYIDNYNVPESWVANAFDPEVMKQDSIIDASLDIHIADLDGYSPGARFIMLDACFNGSFHLEDYISGHYIFNPGNTIVVKANSVNTLQDIWTNQLIGLLDLGVSVGNWAKEQFTLESHLMGDPTYRYSPARKDLEHLNNSIAHQRGDVKLWKKLSKDSNPEVRALALKMLFVNKAIGSDDLYKVQTNDPNPTTRLMAFYLINKKYNNMIVPSIKAGLFDSYEMIRRFAAKEASTNQSPELLLDIMKASIEPGTTKRVEFQAKGAAEVFPKKEALKAFDQVVGGKQGAWYDQKAKQRERLEYVLSRNETEFAQLLDPSAEARSKRFTITALRNSNNVSYLDTLFRFMEESGDNDLRILLAEAFGWFTNSWKRDEIVGFCKELAAKEKDAAVKAELLRTVRRLTD
jgi:hypothetical protein